MKKYIGTKTVYAQPMAADEARENGYKVGDNTGNAYEIEYKAGYKSWSPDKAFEEAHQVAETPLDRMEIPKVREMTREELKKRASSIIDMLDGLFFNEQLNVIGLAAGVLGYTLYMTGTLEDKERQQEILTDITKHLESIKVNISVFAPQAIRLLEEAYKVKEAEK